MISYQRNVLVPAQRERRTYAGFRVEQPRLPTFALRSFEPSFISVCHSDRRTRRQTVVSGVNCVRDFSHRIEFSLRKADEEKKKQKNINFFVFR